MPFTIFSCYSCGMPCGHSFEREEVEKYTIFAPPASFDHKPISSAKMVSNSTKPPASASSHLVVLASSGVVNALPSPLKLPQTQVLSTSSASLGNGQFFLATCALVTFQRHMHVTLTPTHHPTHAQTGRHLRSAPHASRSQAGVV